MIGTSKSRWLGIGVIVFALIGAGIIAWSLNRSILPSRIRNQISYPVFYPTDHNPAKAIRSTIKYDKAQQLLTYTARTKASELIISNQPTPDAFVEVPATYEKVLSAMHPYAAFDSSLGKVTLARPDNLNHQQIAVANSQGTLMFVRVNSAMSEDQWRQFFSNLVKVP